MFVSSHLLCEVERACDRIAIVHRGRTLASGPVRELVDRVASDRLRLTARPARRAVEVLAPFGAAEIAGDGAGMEDEGAIDARIPKAKVPDALRALTAAGVDVFAVERSLASLEEVFLEVTGGETV